jgi:hypothetical protein
VIRHVGDDEGIGVAEGEVEGLDLVADALGGLLGRGPPLAAATLEKTFGTLRGVGDLEEILGHGRLHDVGTVEEGGSAQMLTPIGQVSVTLGHFER